MARIIRSKPNYLPMVNGIAFTFVEEGRSISEEVKASVAKQFAEMPGYAVETPAEAKARAAAESAAEADPEGNEASTAAAGNEEASTAAAESEKSQPKAAEKPKDDTKDKGRGASAKATAPEQSGDSSGAEDGVF